jgi:hypothetical protein
MAISRRWAVRTSALSLRDAVKGQRDDLFKKAVFLPLHCILEADGSLATPLLRTLVAGTGPAHTHRIAARAPRRPHATYHRSVHVWWPQWGMVVS